MVGKIVRIQNQMGSVFVVEGLCNFKQCHVFNMADGNPRCIVGRPSNQRQATGIITLIAERMVLPKSLFDDLS